MLLVLREEIICIIILTFIIFYYLINKVQDKEDYFLKISALALAHLVFDALTVFSVNNLDTVPEVVNRTLHICFYFAGILFIKYFYEYVLHICSFYKRINILKNAGNLALAAFGVILLFLPMEYRVGHGTNYSYGPLAFLGYGLFMVYCLLSLVILFASKKRLNNRVKWALIPMIFVMCATVLIQAFIPELLMTGAGVTFVILGMFIALNNPDKNFKEQALWDFLTGLKNRNSYNIDLASYIYRLEKKGSSHRIGFVVADMNYLKLINDNYGHVEGDRLISGAAAALKENLKSAKNVYRLGGDEFVAVYLSPNDDTVMKEMENVRAACEKDNNYAVPLRIAMGYSSGTIDNGTEPIFNKADELMYENKIEMKKKENIALGPDNR